MNFHAVAVIDYVCVGHASLGNRNDTVGIVPLVGHSSGARHVLRWQWQARKVRRNHSHCAHLY